MTADTSFGIQIGPECFDIISDMKLLKNLSH